MSKVLRSALALATIATLVIGVPWALVAFGRFDALRGLTWSHLLVVPDTGGLVLAAMTAAGWIAWVVLMASLASELVAALSRGRVRVTVPGTALVQPFVAVLVASALSIITAPSAAAESGADGTVAGGSGGVMVSRATPDSAPWGRDGISSGAIPPAQPRSAVTEQGATSRAGDDGTDVSHGMSPKQAAAPGDDGQPVAPQPQGRTFVLHEVAPGEDLWTIAEQYYGDGTQWRRIAQQNDLDPVQPLAVGLQLRLDGPVAPVVTAQATDAVGDDSTQHEEPPGAVVVEAGDSLQELARRHLGDGNRWTEIWELNRQTIANPDLIQPGWQVEIPSTNTTEHAGQTDLSHTAPAEGEDEALGAPASSPPGSETDEPGPEGSKADESGPAGSKADESGPAGSKADESGPAGSKADETGRTMERAPGAPPPVRDSGAPAPGSVADLPGSAPRGPQGADPASLRVPTESGFREPDATAGMAAAADQIDELAAVRIAVGGLLAAGLVGALASRRREQLLQRTLGRRIPQAEPDHQRFEAALARVASERTEPPQEVPVAGALLGVDADEEPLIHDLEAAVTTTVSGDGRLVDSFLAAVATGLVLHPWSAESRVLIAGDLPWMRSLDEPQAEVCAQVEAAVEQLERQVMERRLALGRARADGAVVPANPEKLASPGKPVELSQLRAAPETGEAWAPFILVLADDPTPEQWGRIQRSLEGSPVGVSVLAVGDQALLAGEHIQVSGAGAARCEKTDRDFRPCLLDPAARRALTDLFEQTSSTDTTQAPWWTPDDDLPPNLALINPRRPARHFDEESSVDTSGSSHPTLLLLGPVDLRGCRGIEPNRARRQCMEYCAWIHQNPGRTSTAMARDLLVAEGTRRSNLSRLRNWLGDDPNGEPYLPDAYSGRIQLHPAVDTDWEHLQLMIAAGVNRTSTDALVDALQLVRGAPLADAAPGQWYWAEELRTDMVSVIRDIGVVLTERALQSNNLELARWAAARALQAAPGDELLMQARLSTEHAAGNQHEVERLVLQVTRQARNLGIDLREDTVALIQEVMEGRRRAQQA
ncbi:LysM peptidoglycan-binding domain-containing protein [Luteococcus sp. Sow4_B9]|uniref:LysM peptidoglycan-binding domain-containing protein n=1 Tax=Luteococcus sp. Sow4_B9 TaxID=3438792 RepID=UPI003F97B073